MVATAASIKLPRQLNLNCFDKSNINHYQLNKQTKEEGTRSSPRTLPIAQRRPLPETSHRCSGSVQDDYAFVSPVLKTSFDNTIPTGWSFDGVRETTCIMRQKKIYKNHNESLEIQKFFRRPFHRVVSIVNLKSVVLHETLIITFFKSKTRRKIKIVSKNIGR